VLEDAPEFSPEPLLDDMLPSMLAVASAAARAATDGRGAHAGRVQCW